MRFLKAFYCCFVVLLIPIAAHAQTTGLYPFGPFDTRGFDTINRGNLNIHFSIPIFSKPGRGGSNFAYSLSYDGLVWSPQSSSGASAWTPAPAWGWADVTNAQWGYVTYNESLNNCTLPPHGIQADYAHFSGFVFHDHSGNTHRLPFAYSDPCGNEGDPTSTGSYPLTDNSGYTVYRNGMTFIFLTRTARNIPSPPT